MFESPTRRATPSPSPSRTRPARSRSSRPALPSPSPAGGPSASAAPVAVAASVGPAEPPASPISDALPPCGSALDCNPVMLPVLGGLAAVLLVAILVSLVVLVRGPSSGYVIAVVDVVYTANVGHGSNLGISFLREPGVRGVSGMSPIVDDTRRSGSAVSATTARGARSGRPSRRRRWHTPRRGQFDGRTPLARAAGVRDECGVQGGEPWLKSAPAERPSATDDVGGHRRPCMVAQARKWFASRHVGVDALPRQPGVDTVLQLVLSYPP